jgi:uncharacterized protein YbaP (TraB family)
MVRKGNARVFLLGFAEGRANEESWFTPPIRKAFGDSTELWLEVAPAEAPGTRSAAEKAAADAAYEKLAHESVPGRTFFDDLTPAVRKRTLAYMSELGILKEAVETLRPWSAYYKINAAFWARMKLPYEPVNEDEVLRTLAMSQGKRVCYEMPSGLAFAQFMAALPDAAQSQYIEFLLDFLDDTKKGLDSGSSDWMTGNPTTSQRALNRMRAQTPDLYEAMQVRRNGWWAHKIGELLAKGGTYFVAVGELHVIGPDSIPSQLKRSRSVESSEVRENPSIEAIG